MAPPTPFTTKYDVDIKRHIIEVRDKITGEAKKFVYNEDSVNFEGAVEPNVVFERDLEPCYATTCSRHTKIVFCKSKWSKGAVYKYREGDESGPWTRVQCLCCQYDKNQVVEEQAVETIKASMRPDREVDDSKHSYLWMQPVFSRFCKSTQKMTVFASVYPSQEHLLPFNFDLVKENFVRSECEDVCCQEIPEWNRHAARLFDFGSQGLYYARHHRDQAGRPLMCLAVNWYNSEHGLMEIFLNQDGDIGKYVWNERCQCFDLVKTLDVRTLNHNVPEAITSMKPELWYDDGLRFVSTQTCPTLNETIFFCYHANDGKYRKYVFNATALQFVYIQCPCCSYRDRYTNIQEGLVATYKLSLSGAVVSLFRTANNGFEKVLYTATTGGMKTLERSPIRIDAHLQPYEIIPRRLIENQKEQMVHILIDGHAEGWMIRQQRVSIDGSTAIGTVAMMDGSVKPFLFSTAKRQYVIYEKDVAEVEKPVLVKRRDGRYALDWDLTPKAIFHCNHSGDQIVKAYNHFSHSMGYFNYDSETGHIHENAGCVECEKDFHPASPDQSLLGAGSPFSAQAVILITNQEGRLMKLGYNPATEKYNPMPPFAIIKQHDEIGFLQNRPYKKSELQKEMITWQEKFARLERELVVEKREKMKASKEVERLRTASVMSGEFAAALNAEIAKLTEERDELKKKEEEQRKPAVFEDDALEKMSTDFDLVPKYRNYCEHTGHFYLTAYNVVTEQTSHYVFNPNTAAFHRQEYCSQCPRQENGVKIHGFVTIMPVSTPKSNYPYLIMTNHHGRLVKIAFDINIKGFVSLEPTEIEKPVQTLSEIPDSIGNRDVMEMPAAELAPYDTDLVPKFRVFCTHLSDFLINAYNAAIGERGFYVFNSHTGHLEQHHGCDICQKTSPMYQIEPLRSIMPVMTPYSKWPLMLTTDKDGKFLPIAFRPDSHKFENMGPLAIRMLASFDRNTLPQVHVDPLEQPLEQPLDDAYVEKPDEEKEEKEEEVESTKLSAVDPILEQLMEKAEESEGSDGSDEEEDEEDEEESEGSDGSDDDEYCDCSGSECDCSFDEDEEEDEEEEESEYEDDENPDTNVNKTPETPESEDSGADDDDDDEYYCECSGSECECSDCSDEDEEEEEESDYEEETSQNPLEPLQTEGSLLSVMNSLFPSETLNSYTGERSQPVMERPETERVEHTISVEERMREFARVNTPMTLYDDIQSTLVTRAMDQMNIDNSRIPRVVYEDSSDSETEERFADYLDESTATALEPEVVDEIAEVEVFSTVEPEELDTEEDYLHRTEDETLAAIIAAVELADAAITDVFALEMVSSTATAIEPEEEVSGASSDSDLSFVDDAAKESEMPCSSSSITAVKPEVVVPQVAANSSQYDRLVYGWNEEREMFPHLRSVGYDSDTCLIDHTPEGSEIYDPRAYAITTDNTGGSDSDLSFVDDADEDLEESEMASSAVEPDAESKANCAFEYIWDSTGYVIGLRATKDIAVNEELGLASSSIQPEDFVRESSDSDLSFVEEEMLDDAAALESEMVSSTMTAVEPEADEMASSTATAIEPQDGSSSDSDLSLIDTQGSESEPEFNMVASTATAIEENVADQEDVSSLSSDISYLDSDLGSDNGEDSDASEEPEVEEPESEERAAESVALPPPAVAPETCVIS